MEMANGIIKNTICREDHGILTVFITIEGDGWGGGFGGLSTSCLTSFIEGVTDLLECGWEDLPGKMVRCEFTHAAMGRIARIGHPIKDKWISTEGIIQKSKAQR